jgi:arsenate reductase (glutaredoxin)
VEYLKSPPGTEEIARVLDLLGLDPRGLMRRKEAAYRERGLDDPALAPEALIRAMTEEPILIERPVVLANGRAALGRPPEAVLALFE